MMDNYDLAVLVNTKLNDDTRSTTLDEFFDSNEKTLYVSDDALTALVLSPHSIILFQCAITHPELAEMLGLCF